MSTHDSALPVGHRLDEYLIAKLLGHGGFGITYLAQDTNLNAFVAIKEFLPMEFAVRAANSRVMPRSDTDNESYRWGLDRFKDEARALARFKHPNIVRAARLLEANGTAYMVMDYEPGMTLSQYLKKHGPVLDEAHLLGIFLPVLDGLEALHAEKLVHRDIKPGNIYLRAKGGPMLIDFGAVRQAIGTQTRSLTTLVTPGYAPIEQYSIDGRQGAWTDLYATGATMYYCMFGHAPADATRRSAAMSDDTLDPYLSAHTKNAGRYSAALVDAVDSALHFKARDRPQAAHELRERLAKSPVAPLHVELPDALREMPLMQDGVITNQHSQPGAASLDPLFVLPDSGLRPRTTLNDGEATRPAVGGHPFTDPTQQRTYREANPGAEAATLLMRPSLFARIAAYISSRRNRLQARLAAEPVTQVSDDNTKPIPLTLSYWLEPKRAGLWISGTVLILLLAAVVIFMRRPSDEHRFALAATADTLAAYQQYLQDCGRCAYRADADKAVARLTQAEKLAGLKGQFRDLLARGELKAPASPNAGSVLHDLAALAANDPDLPALRNALSDAEKHQAELVAAARPKAKTAPKQRPVKPTRVAQSQTLAPATALADSGEPVAEPVTPLHPRYPQSARGYGKAGWVEVDFMVQPDGSISDVQVVGAQPKSVFDQAAMGTVYAARFKPYTEDGTPVRKRMRLRLEFRP